MSGFTKIGKIVTPVQKEEDKYISREFQEYGLSLAEELNDMRYKTLYIKLAKTTPRGLLESARTFVKDATNAKSKGKLFMWKLKQLKGQTKKLQNSKNPKLETN